MFYKDYETCWQVCQQNRIRLAAQRGSQKSRVVTSPFLERRTDDHGAIYHQLTMCQITRDCDKYRTSLSQQRYYPSASRVSIFTHCFHYPLGVYSQSRIAQEGEVQA